MPASASHVYWSGSQSALFAGPVPPTLPTAFWLNNATLPYVLNYWLDAPDFTYLPLGSIDPASSAFTPTGDLGGNGGGGVGNGVSYVSSTSAPSDTTLVWIDLSSGSVAARPVMHHVASSWVQVGWYDPGAGDFSGYAPHLDDCTVTPSLAAIASPQPGDEAWLTTGSGSVWTKQLYLNGVWTPTGESFDSVTNSYQPSTLDGGSGDAPVTVPEEWSVAASLPITGGGENVIWLEAGQAPNRTWTEHVQLGSAWVATGRSYDEASGTFSSGAVADTGVGTGPGLALFLQQEARGVGGGNMVAGAWRDRPLNFNQFNGLSGVNLNDVTGEITITASRARRFLIEATAAAGFYFSGAFRAHAHQLRVVDGANAQLLIGHAHFDDNATGNLQTGANDYALLFGVVTLPMGTHSLRLQHAFDWAPDSHSSEMGHPVGHSMDLSGFTTLGGPEVFASLKLMELA